MVQVVIVGAGGVGLTLGQALKAVSLSQTHDSGGDIIDADKLAKCALQDLGTR